MRLILAVLAGLAFGPHQALALDRGDCGTPETMTAKLKAEGQRSVAMADEVGGPEHRAIIFTMNADRSVGYVLRSDKGTDTKAGEFCVHSRLASVRFYDARKPDPHPGAYLRTSDEDARRRCTEMVARGNAEKGACWPLRTILDTQARKGVRPVLQGFNVEKGADPAQAWRSGVLVTFVANILRQGKGRDPTNPLHGEEGILLYSTLPEGATVDDEILFRPSYTEYGLSLLSN